MLKIYIENLRIALTSVRSQLLRTVLTVMIIMIGITSLVGILTVVSALESTISKDFASMGANTFDISRFDNEIRTRGAGEREILNPIITYSDAAEFKNDFNFPLADVSISFNAAYNAEIKYDSKKTDPENSIMGVDEYFLTNSGLEMSKGRNFNKFDISNNSFVCVVGSDYEKSIFKDTNPLNKIISLRGARFKVIGVLKEKGSTFGNSQDLRVFIPIQLARSLYSSPNINYSIRVMVAQKELIESAIDQATLTMRKVRRITPIRDNNFGLQRSDDLINRILSITSYLDIASWVIGIITILGSSIALMNIMIVSVTERIREIGVRKALGAKKKTIASQFFIETLFIGLLGGAIGIIFGISIGNMIAHLIGFKFVIPWMVILAAFTTSFLVAIISGLYPAIKAANLDPVDSLRHE